MINADANWIKEVVPPNLKTLCDKICHHFGIPAGHVGTKGNTAHTGGYHRSRSFLVHSSYSGNRTYSVTEPGNLGGNEHWISAIDISLPSAPLIAMCKRLDAAVRSGKFEKIAEWYGNDDGDNRVDGYDNIRNRVASSDSSHLWHAHISFLRSRANDNHDDVLDVLIGTEVDMTPEQNTMLSVVHGRVGEVYNILSSLKNQDKAAAANAAASATRDATTVAAITALSNALSVGSGTPVDVAVILKAIRDEGERTRKQELERAGDNLKAINAAAASLGA